MGPPFREGNTHPPSPTFFFCSFRASAASDPMDAVRQAFFVFNGASMISPSIPATCRCTRDQVDILLF